MMKTNRRKKIEELFAKLNGESNKGSELAKSFEAFIGDVDDRIFSIKTKTNEIKSVDNSLKEFKSSIEKELLNLSSKEEINQLQNNFKLKYKEIEKSIKSSVAEIQSDIVDLSNAIDKNLSKFYTKEDTNKTLSGFLTKKEINEQVSIVKDENNNQIKTIKEQLELHKTKIESSFENINKTFEQLKNRINTVSSYDRGGNANRNITLNSNSVLGKYTDINFLNSTSIGWIATEDNTKKVVNISASVLSASGGGGGSFTVEVPVGSVNGTNTSFTVSNTPKVVVVDGLSRRSGKGYDFNSNTSVISVDSLSPPVYDIFSQY